MSDVNKLVAILAPEGSGIPQLRYSSLSAFFRTYVRIRDRDPDCPIFFVHGVTASIFEEILERQDNGRHKCRFQLFLPEAELLIVKIRKAPYETLHRLLYTHIHQHFNNSALAWVPVGSTTYPVWPEERATVGAAEAASLGKPTWIRPAGNEWPTLIIEDGTSETLPCLHRAMRWWFSASEHQVKVVLLAYFEKPQDGESIYDRLIIEKWVETSPPTRSGVLTRAQAAQLNNPTLHHKTTIAYSGPLITAENINNINQDDFYIAGEGMVLEFSNLMLRQPQNAEEKDYVVSTEYWKFCAEAALLQSVKVC